MKNSYALVFPGQGSQSLGMLNSFYETHPSIVDDYCHRASVVLGYDLAALIKEGPEEKLNKTEYTQPALLVASVIAWEIWKTYVQEKPLFLSGHSLGEYSALTCSGSLNFEEAVKLVQARGQYMQNAVPEGEGAMAAIVGLSNEAVYDLCHSIGDENDLAPANFNSPGQVVIAGKTAAIESAIIAAKTKGAKMALRLPMSVPSHCPLMRPAAQALSETLETVALNMPNIAVINNVDVGISLSVEDIKSALVRQLYSSVRWVEIIQFMIDQGVKTIVECGPGKILTGLIKRIDKNINTFSLSQEDVLTKVSLL